MRTVLLIGWHEPTNKVHDLFVGQAGTSRSAGTSFSLKSPVVNPFHVGYFNDEEPIDLAINGYEVTEGFVDGVEIWVDEIFLFNWLKAHTPSLQKEDVCSIIDVLPLIFGSSISTTIEGGLVVARDRNVGDTLPERIQCVVEKVKIMSTGHATVLHKPVARVGFSNLALVFVGLIKVVKTCDLDVVPIGTKKGFHECGHGGLASSLGTAEAENEGTV